MSFIRIKTIAGNDYAYLVESKWYKRRHKGKNKGPRQKVSKYLGRAYSFDKANDKDFLTFKYIDDLEQYLNNNNKNQIFRDLVEWELFRHDINKEEFTIDFNTNKIMKGKKEVSMRMNEGFLNSFTLNRLFNLKAGESYYLAKCFVEAGIDVPKEVFVGLFGK